MNRNRRGRILRTAAIVLLALAVLGVAALHLCPPFELWLHHVTGWY